jgi:hypothetical protein
MATYQGIFKPKNRDKYVGNADQIVYRSGWEARFMAYLDRHPDIIKWQSEEVIVPYTCPTDNKTHRYFPDFVVQKRSSDGTIATMMIEIKPERETLPPKPTKSKTERRLIKEALTFAKNQAKWAAAEQFCQVRGWTFKVMTEKHLFGR